MGTSARLLMVILARNGPSKNLGDIIELPQSSLMLVLEIITTAEIPITNQVFGVSQTAADTDGDFVSQRIFLNVEMVLKNKVMKWSKKVLNVRRQTLLEEFIKLESWTNASTSAKLFKNNSPKLMVIGSNKEVLVLAAVVLKG